MILSDRIVLFPESRENGFRGLGSDLLDLSFWKFPPYGYHPPSVLTFERCTRTLRETRSCSVGDFVPGATTGRLTEPAGLGTAELNSIGARFRRGIQPFQMDPSWKSLGRNNLQTIASDHSGKFIPIDPARRLIFLVLTGWV